MQSTKLISPRRPEITLLLACARVHLDPAQAAIVRGLAQQDLDWSYLLETAQAHALQPLLYRQLKANGAEHVPLAVLEQLRAAFEVNTAQSLALTAELVRLRALFREQQLEILAFKGPVLARLAYNNLALRQFVDLDILVKEEDVLRASALLLAHGYEVIPALTPVQQRYYLKLGYEQTFWHAKKELKVDLHWSLLPKGFSFTPGPAFSWERVAQVRLGHTDVPTLPQENLLLFLCMHGAKHNWSSLNWICDLAELLNSSPGLDWQRINRLAAQTGSHKMLMLGLYLTQHLLGTKLEGKVPAQLISDPRLPALAALVEDWLFDTSPVQRLRQPETPLTQQGWHTRRRHYTSRFTAWLRRDAVYLQTMPTLRDKLWYWFDEVIKPTPLEWHSVPLPPSLFFLYYFLRPVRLTLKYLLRKY